MAFCELLSKEHTGLIFQIVSNQASGYEVTC